MLFCFLMAFLFMSSPLGGFEWGVLGSVCLVGGWFVDSVSNSGVQLTHSGDWSAVWTPDSSFSTHNAVYSELCF